MRRSHTIESLKEIVFIRAAPLRKTGNYHNGYHAGLFFTDGWTGPFLRNEVFIKCKNIGRYDIWPINEFLRNPEGRGLLFKIAGISDIERLLMYLDDVESAMGSNEIDTESLESRAKVIAGMNESNATEAVDEPEKSYQPAAMIDNLLGIANGNDGIKDDIDLIYTNGVDNRKKAPAKKRVMELVGIERDSYDSLADAWSATEQAIINL